MEMHSMPTASNPAAESPYFVIGNQSFVSVEFPATNK